MGGGSRATAGARARVTAGATAAAGASGDTDLCRFGCTSVAVSSRFSFALAALALTQASSAAVLRRLELGSQVASSNPTQFTRYSTFLPDLRSSRIASISHSWSSELIVPWSSELIVPLSKEAAAGLSSSRPCAFALVQELHTSTSQRSQHHLVLPLWKSCSHPPSHARSSSSRVVNVLVRGLLHSGHGSTGKPSAAFIHTFARREVLRGGAATLVFRVFFPTHFFPVRGGQNLERFLGGPGGSIQEYSFLRDGAAWFGRTDLQAPREGRFLSISRRPGFPKFLL